MSNNKYNWLRIVVAVSSHWWIKENVFAVFANEEDWPKDSKNERGINFEGKGTHFRLLDQEKYILKSECRIAELHTIADETYHFYELSVIRCIQLYPDYAKTYDWLEAQKEIAKSIGEGKFNEQKELSKKAAEEQINLLKWKPPTITDPVNHPAHYTDGRIEVIEFIEDKKLSFHLGNAVKYIARAGKKYPAKTVEDLQKAIWYINRQIELYDKDTMH